MKTFNVIHILLFVLMMLVYQCVKAQDYILTSKGDTLRGETKPISFGAEKKVQLIADNKKTIHPIFKVREFTYRGDRYQPVKGVTGYSFMKVIKSGYLSLYSFQLDNQVTYDGQFLTKKDGSGIEVPNLAFKKTMSHFLEDCASVSDKIKSGDLGKKNLELIVDEYNACVQNKTTTPQKTPVIVQSDEVNQKIKTLDALETTIKSKTDFDGKNDALEMVSEIKNKINRGEKIPNFLVEGLKNSLGKSDITTELDNALQQIKN
jgi:hypothetical protein